MPYVNILDVKYATIVAIGIARRSYSFIIKNLRGSDIAMNNKTDIICGLTICIPFKKVPSAPPIDSKTLQIPKAHKNANGMTISLASQSCNICLLNINRIETPSKDKNAVTLILRNNVLRIKALSFLAFASA